MPKFTSSGESGQRGAVATRALVAALVLILSLGTGVVVGRVSSGVTQLRDRVANLEGGVERLRSRSAKARRTLRKARSAQSNLENENSYLKEQNRSLLVRLGEQPATPDEILEAVRSSTVLVTATHPDGSYGSGTGWVLDAEAGLVITNHHVVNSGTDYKVGVSDELRAAQLYAAMPCDDLAVLRVEDNSGLTTLPLGSQEDLRQGEQVVAVGYPKTLSPTNNLTATSGIVSVISTDIPSDPPHEDMVQTDAAINPGNSGGPLVNAANELVGVNTLTWNRDYYSIEGQGYAIGVDRLKELMPQLLEGSSSGWAGVLFDSREEILAEEGYPDGLVVNGALSGSWAEQAGLGDEPWALEEVNGQPIDPSITSYCDAVAEVTAEETAVFTIVEDPGMEPVQVEASFQ